MQRAFVTAMERLGVAPGDTLPAEQSREFANILCAGVDALPTSSNIPVAGETYCPGSFSGSQRRSHLEHVTLGCQNKRSSNYGSFW